MILLAALLATPLAPGCRQVEGAIRCVLAPPVHVASPPTPPVVPHAAPHGGGRHRAVRRAVSRKAKRKAPLRPAAPPTSAEIAHHLDLLVAAADCTGARTLVAATESAAAADTLFQTCLRTAARPGSSGSDLRPVPGEAAAGVGGAKPVQHR